MFKKRKKHKQSLLKRLVYLLMLLSGGGAGIGGWSFKDDPRVQTLWTLATGKPADGDSSKLDGSLVTAVIDRLKPFDEFSQPGIYQVIIPKVQLDSTLFKAGHTVDIQAKVSKLDPRGRDSTLWESKTYGERLVVAGKDDLTAGWPHRPFQVEWNTGEQIVVEVFDRKTGLFMEPKRFILAPPEPAPREFPLKTGTFPLEPAQKPDPPVDPRNTNIVLQSQRVGELRQAASANQTRQNPRIGSSSARSGADAADDSIIIK
jgi:hypothetical protein